MCTTIKPCTYKSNVRMKSSLGNQWMFRFQPQISPMSGSDYLYLGLSEHMVNPKRQFSWKKRIILSGTLFSGSVKFLLIITPKVINPHSPMGCSPLLIKMGGHPQIKENILKKKNIFISEWLEMRATQFSVFFVK